MFNITMLPTAHGDALWIEYGTDESVHHICIDGGPVHTFDALKTHAQRLPQGERAVELLVISHIDTDHIEGMVRMLASPRKDWLFYPDEIWFNGYQHLLDNALGGRDGEYLSALLRKHAPEQWNKSFRNGPVIVPDNGSAQPVTLSGGMELTLLSPSRDKLRKLGRKWLADLYKADLVPGNDTASLQHLSEDRRYRAANPRTLGGAETDGISVMLGGIDQSEANGSSIAFLARYAGHSCLFLADAHADMISESIRGLLQPGSQRLIVDAVKVSHHGSRNNISLELLGLLDAKHYLFSTNGDRHGHPDRDAVNAIIACSQRDPVLWFNYRSPTTNVYHDLRGTRPYQTRYPKSGQQGITLQLQDCDT